MKKVSCVFSILLLSFFVFGQDAKEITNFLEKNKISINKLSTVKIDNQQLKSGSNYKKIVVTVKDGTAEHKYAVVEQNESLFLIPKDFNQIDLSINYSSPDELIRSFVSLFPEEYEIESINKEQGKKRLREYNYSAEIRNTEDNVISTGILKLEINQFILLFANRKMKVPYFIPMF